MGAADGLTDICGAAAAEAGPGETGRMSMSIRDLSTGRGRG